MKAFGHLSLFAFGLILTSCQTQTGSIAVTYLSDPPNAALYRGDSNMQIGRAPQTVRYAASPADMKAGKVTLGSVTARWASGASSSTGPIEADLNAGDHQEFTLIRPAGVPGADIDANFAVNFAQNKIAAERNEILKQANDIPVDEEGFNPATGSAGSRSGSQSGVGRWNGR